MSLDRLHLEKTQLSLQGSARSLYETFGLALPAALGAKLKHLRLGAANRETASCKDATLIRIPFLL